MERFKMFKRRAVALCVGAVMGGAVQAGDATLAHALGDAGFKLLRQQTQAGGLVGNAVVSPLSLGAALGLLQQGTSGATQSELERWIASSSRQGRQFYATQLPAWQAELQKTGAVTLANRLWVDATLTAALQPGYADAVRTRYGAEPGSLVLTEPEQARASINAWVSEQTRKQVPELLPSGAISSASRLVVTNAVHFASRWEQPFDPLRTQVRPFTLEGGTRVDARTMQAEREVRLAQVSADQALVIELPFEGGAFSLLVAMPTSERPLGAFLERLKGADLTRWRTQLKPQACMLSLPRFELLPTPQSLKAALKASGVKTMFSHHANFTPMLTAAAAKGLHVENVFQSASLRVDEMGGVAAAATAAVVSVKSMPAPQPPCAVVDRPFVFALIHQASGAPLFVGRVVNPAQN